MPAGYAHTVFGRRVLAALPPAQRDAALAAPALFWIGVQGPDILFYANAPLPGPISRLGSALHAAPARPFFENGLRVLPAGGAAAQSYLLGVGCHFALDSACHGYVEKKRTADGVTHAAIETELDRLLMLRDGLDPLAVGAMAELAPARDAAAAIAPFYPPLAPRDIYRGLAALHRVDRLLVCPHAPKRAVVGLALRIAGRPDMLMLPAPRPACRNSSLALCRLLEAAVERGVQTLGALCAAAAGGAALPAAFDATFGPCEGWQDIPILSYEEEQRYEV